MVSKKTKAAVCFFGTYESTFPRTITLKKACGRLNIKVIECHLPFWEKTREKFAFFTPKSLFQIVFQLILIYIRLTVRYLFKVEDHDAVIVGYNGYFDMPLAKLLARMRRKPVIVTPVFPLYETLVEDRKYINKFSLKSKVIHFIDGASCRLADLIIIETKTYLDYYCREFNVPREKFYKIPLGADEVNFFPRPTSAITINSSHMNILFYGKFIPLQGIPYIIKTAKILENDKDISFEIIGSGQLSEEINALAQSLHLQNVTFIDWVDYQSLPHHIQKADICLGIFGDTLKARRGIPIKVYEALAMKKPVITGDSPAAREVFQPKVNAVLCPMANPEALAESILLLKKDKELRQKIAEAGFRLYQHLFSSSVIAQEFKKALEKLSS